jgi:hypothetical protein
MASAAIDTNSASLPAQLYEVAVAAQNAELAYNADPLNTTNPLFTAVNNVSIDADFEAKTVSITATLPMVTTIAPSGQIVLTIQDYL